MCDRAFVGEIEGEGADPVGLRLCPAARSGMLEEYVRTEAFGGEAFDDEDDRPKQVVAWVLEQE